MNYPYPIELIYRLCRLGATVAIVAIISRYGYLSIEGLAGHETRAALGLDLAVSLKRMASCVMFGAIGATGLIYGVVQHILRSRTVRRLGKRNKELENRFDSGRQSSEGGS